LNPFQKILLSLKEIGLFQLFDFAKYKLQLMSGWVEKRTLPSGFTFPSGIHSEDVPFLDFPLSTAGNLQDKVIRNKAVLMRADELVNGEYRPFGGELQELKFDQWSSPLKHWTGYSDVVEGIDIKFIWEPARFSWAFDLAQAYLQTGGEHYACRFWERFDEFNAKNQVNLGPNWTSAQEVAIRIITWGMVFPIFSKSVCCSDSRINQFLTSLWQHASRIPITLTYARAQNNNHLLSEALGLFVAGASFSGQSGIAAKWLETRIREFNRGLLKQIEPDGTYIQHSVNYHRLMLQLALVYYAYAQQMEVQIPEAILERLAAATKWMIAQLDPVTGRLPNLGHNDGALLLPMGCDGFRDYRPTAQAASLAFLGTPCLPPGPWDELSTWLGLIPVDPGKPLDDIQSHASHIIKAGKNWATLRGVRFNGRPAHADQLHVELWLDGINIAQDAGTYSYNADPPWNNSLSTSAVHNTITIDGKDQMVRAGKFLWLQQANAVWQINPGGTRLTASHDGYRNIGITHTRSIEFSSENCFNVEDLITMKPGIDSRLVTLHWLLPDWKWMLDGQSLTITNSEHQVVLTTCARSEAQGFELIPEDITLYRAGERAVGKRNSQILGWVSPTYGVKEPALSFSVSYHSSTSIVIKSQWIFSRSDTAKEY
jgi:hypothetical protein